MVRDERKTERLSLKKQLKIKCQEQNPNYPASDKALVRVEMTGDVYQPVPLSCYGQPSMAFLSDFWFFRSIWSRFRFFMHM